MAKGGGQVLGRASWRPSCLKALKNYIGSCEDNRAWIG